MSKVISIDLRRITTLHTRQTVMSLIQLHTKHWLEYKKVRLVLRIIIAALVMWGLDAGWDDINTPLLCILLALRLASWALWFILDNHIRKAVLTIKHSEFYR